MRWYTLHIARHLHSTGTDLQPLSAPKVFMRRLSCSGVASGGRPLTKRVLPAAGWGCCCTAGLAVPSAGLSAVAGPSGLAGCSTACLPASACRSRTAQLGYSVYNQILQERKPRIRTKPGVISTQQGPALCVQTLAAHASHSGVLWPCTATWPNHN